MGKSKTDKWTTPEALEKIGAWARRGLTEEQIAGNMGVSRQCLYNLRKRCPAVEETLEANKELPDIQIENALFAAAIGGNVTAQIYWLKNRQPKYWRERPEAAEPGNLQKAIEILQGIPSAID